MLKVLVRFCAGALLASASHQTIAQSADWTVSEARGPVSIISAQGFEAATRGAGVNPGDTIVTGRGGRAVLVHKKDFVTVAANSRVRIPREGAQTGITRFFQEIGSAIFNVEKRGTPHFSVDTPFLAAVVKGTVFSVSVNADSTALQVTEGVVEVATVDGGARDLVRPGSIAMIAAGDRYRLTISGDRAATIDSPARTSLPATTPASPAPSLPAETPTGSKETPGSAAQKSNVTPEEPVQVRIEEAVVSKPVDLAKTTNGILTGMSPVSVAAAIGLSKVVAAAPARETVLASASPVVSEKPAEKPDVVKADDRSDAGTPSPAIETAKPADPEKSSPSETVKPAETSGNSAPADKPADKPEADKPDDGGKGKDKPEADKPDDGGKGKDKPEAGKPDADDKGKDKPDKDKPDAGDKGKEKPDKPDAGDKGKDKPDAGKPDDGGKGKDKGQAGRAGGQG